MVATKVIKIVGPVSLRHERASGTHAISLVWSVCEVVTSFKSMSYRYNILTDAAAAVVSCDTKDVAVWSLGAVDGQYEHLHGIFRCC